MWNDNPPRVFWLVLAIFAWVYLLGYVLPMLKR